MADLMSAGPNGPCPYPGELSVTPDTTATAPAAAAAAGGVTVIGADDTGRAACSGVRMTDVKPLAGS